ncbi:MAG: MATE family efflux transporter [Oscillospiraceae bacterium]|nr:MATE family efflux transporter [Oscillospiraceae bacterium]
MIREKSFYREFFVLMMALVLEQIVVLSVNLADNVMIGSYSETALSGVAAVNQIQFVLQQIAYGISGGLVMLASQYWGQNRPEPIRRLTAISLLYALALGAAFFAAVTFAPSGCVRLFVDDPDVITEGARYLSVVRFSYLPFVLTVALLGAMRSVGTVRLAVVSSLVGLVVNCVVNYVLIFGRFGSPELGVVGAAVGTLVARILEFLIVVGYVLLRDRKLCLRSRDLVRIDRQLLADYSRVTPVIMATSAMWGLNNALQTAILGHLNTQSMTAYSITTTVYLLLKVGSVGAANAASILIGRKIGAEEDLRPAVRTMQVLFLAIGAVAGALLFAVRVPILSLYAVSPETYRLANTFFLIEVVTMLGMSYQMPVNTGIIRGGGDTRWVFWQDVISIWMIVLPLSYLAAFRWNLSPVIVVILLNSDQVFKCVPASLRVNSYRWVKKLTRAEEKQESDV